MSRRWRCIGWVPLLVALAYTPLRADSPPEAGERPVSVTEGRGLPDYYVVGKFFETADFYYTRTSREPWRDFLQKLEVPEGSEAERVLAMTTYEAKALASETLDLTPWKDDPLVAKKVQQDHTRSQVRRLGKLWRQFQTDWRKAGQSLEPVLEYLETRSRHQVKLYTLGTRTLDEQRERDEIMAEFSNPDGLD